MKWANTLKESSKNSLKLKAASHNNAGWYTDTDGFLEHSPSGEKPILPGTHTPEDCIYIYKILWDYFRVNRKYISLYHIPHCSKLGIIFLSLMVIFSGYINARLD